MSTRRKNKILSLLAIATLIVIFTGLNPIISFAEEKFEEKFEKTVPLSKNGKVILKNVSGDIEVKSWDREEVKINALKVSRASTITKAKANSQKVQIKVKKEDNIVLIETKYPKTVFKSLNVYVNFKVFVPNEAEIKINSVSGDILVEDISGRIKTETVSGDIEVIDAKKGGECISVSGDVTVQNVHEDFFLKSVSGDITLEAIEGSLETNTVSGDIKIFKVSKANIVKAKTVSGEIEIGKIFDAESIKVSSVSGSIKYQGELNKTGEYSFKSHSGDVRVKIPFDSAFYLEASTFSGNIKSDFDIVVTGEIKKRKIRGTVNGGGADLELSTFSGNIYLQKI